MEIAAATVRAPGGCFNVRVIPAAREYLGEGLRSDWIVIRSSVHSSQPGITDCMIIMYAALRAIPEELYDAAAVDGAGPWRTAWSIKIPAIRPAIMLTVIFSIIGTFQLFNEPQLLDRIAPIAITNSFTPNLYAYNLAFVNQDVNYAATIAFVLGLVTMVISYIVQLSTTRKERA